MARRKGSHRHAGARKAGVSISHEARHALHAKGLKICKIKKPSAYNKRVGACLRREGTSKSAFKRCAAEAAGGRRASAPRRKSSGRKKSSSSSSTNYTRDAFSMW